jgi:indole-3-glycerol phosphate synthase
MTILADIVQRTRQDLERRYPDGLPVRLPAPVSATRPRPSFAAALRRSPGQPVRVIAELKKASPSRGLIRADFRPRELALELAAAGAAALSVLTEPHFFQGHPDVLRCAAAAVGIPILRKDFIVHEVQLAEAVEWGASAVLLIAAALTPAEYGRLYGAAQGMGLDVLSEVHDRRELDIVLAGGADIIGVNSRDLKTFRTDFAGTAELLAAIPAGVLRVAESGIRDGADVRRLLAAGADAFLIGETLMRAPAPGDALRELLTATGTGQGGLAG